MSELKQALIDECQRQFENCLYTSVSFTIWLRVLKTSRLVCMVAPVVFGALATWKVVSQTSPIWGAVFTLLATVIPPAYAASKTNAAIDEYMLAAGEFTNLRDRFRQAASISSVKPFELFEAEARPLLDRMEKARRRMLTPPDWCFKLAQRKIKVRDYEHDYDQQRTAKPDA